MGKITIVCLIECLGLSYMVYKYTRKPTELALKINSLITPKNKTSSMLLAKAYSMDWSVDGVSIEVYRSSSIGDWVDVTINGVRVHLSGFDEKYILKNPNTKMPHVESRESREKTTIANFMKKGGER